MSIVIEQLSKTYGSQIAVNNISFSVGKSEIVGFLGPNGAGKSTTMKMITGYLSPDKGNITVCGLPAGPRQLKAKSKLGYLAEANPLYAEMYVKEYLQFIAHVHGVKDTAKRIDAAIEMVGLTREKNKKTGQLSKGYKQRVGLAAALLHNPEVLILDEPTSGLDPNQIIEIRNVIKSLAEHKTVLFSSHIMQEVEAICDRVIIINKGEIVTDSSLSQLKSSAGSQQSIWVTFDSAVDKTILESLSGVLHVKMHSDKRFELAAHDAEALKKQILQLSIDQNLNIVSLQTGDNSLENIFRKLTNPSE